MTVAVALSAVALAAAGALGSSAAAAAAAGAADRPAAAAPSTVSPMAATSAGTVRATALPTVQIDGIVWTQVVAGDTVFAGGQFTTARPAGAAPGKDTVARSNLLAYSLSTGRLITSFAARLNGKVSALAVSPDHSVLYVGGLFTTANGAARNRLAAFSTATGHLIHTFAPGVNAEVKAIAASNSTVYVGGSFSAADGVARAHLAAFSPATGALLGWAPVTDGAVQALVLNPAGTRLIVGGSEYTINNYAVYGLGAVDATTGATRAFPANRVVRAYGSGSAILSLTTDGDAIYGAAYYYMGDGNGFEGSFSADADTGRLNWIEDCHGDTYSVFASSSNEYVAGHPHFCGNIGGFPDVTNAHSYHALAFTENVTGTVQHNTTNLDEHPKDFAGQPSPSLVEWLPDFTDGTVSGEDQATWSVVGNDTYVAFGGEFPSVNGIAQQGLVRFAVASAGPDTQGPVLTAPSWKPTVTADGSGAERVSITGNWDPDDLVLAYRVLRDTGPGTTATTVASEAADSLAWDEPEVSTDDSGLTPGTTYRYAVSATDYAGNTERSAWVSVTP